MMKLRPCECGLVHYTRVRRRWWMRALGARRWLYECSGCESRMLLPLDAILQKGGRASKRGRLSLAPVHAGA
jgi:hypothetical protein